MAGAVCFSVTCCILPIFSFYMSNAAWSEYRAEWAAQKERAREEQKEKRELVLDDRRAQTAALVTALNAVTKVMERLEVKSAGE